MKRFFTLTAAVLTLSLLAGCMPALVITSPTDEEFQDDWDESMEELRRDREEDLEDDEDDGPWSAWAKSWESWSDDADERFDEMDRKEHVWKILDVSDPEAAITEAGTVTDAGQIEALDDLLGLHDEDAWDGLDGPDEVPDDPAYSYVYSQEKTLLAGQDPDAEREYEDLLRFTVSASEDVVTLVILEDLPSLLNVDLGDILTFHIAVPAETAEALRNPGQFLDERA